MYVLKNKWKK